MTDLLPCPWCGTTPKPIDLNSIGYTSAVQCVNDACEVQPTANGAFIEDAIFAWNFRPSTDAAQLTVALDALLKATQWASGYRYEPFVSERTVGDVHRECRAILYGQKQETVDEGKDLAHSQALQNPPVKP